MKGLNYLILAGLSLVAAISCNKQLAPADEPEVKTGIPMTLTATIGSPDTKLSFTENGNVLKGSWDAEESISIVSLDDEGRVLTIDKFTSSGAEGRKSAEFSGELSANAGETLVAVYPALVDRVEVQGDWRTPESNLRGFKFGEYTMYFSTDGMRQTADADYSHLAEEPIMINACEISEEGQLVVNLTPYQSILKVDLTIGGELPEKVYGIKIESVSDSDVFASGYACIWPVDQLSAREDTELFLGEYGNGIEVPESGKLTLYVPFVPVPGAYFSDKLIVTVATAINRYPDYNSNPKLGAKVISTDFPVSQGMMYRLSLSVI